MNTPSVYLTYGWCRVAFVILHSLAERGIPVHTGDASPLAMCRFSRHSHSFSRYCSPYEDERAFIDDLVRSINRTGCRMLIPAHEDILAVMRHRDRFPHDLILPFAEADQIERLMNKWEVTVLGREAGVPIPETFHPENMVELRHDAGLISYPAVVKTRFGNSAKGVSIVQNKEECLFRFERFVKDYQLDNQHWPILQSFIKGEGYGVCLLYNHGVLKAAFCERYIRCKGGSIGTSVFRESCVVPELITWATAVMNRVAWHGPVHLDFIFDPLQRTGALIEINPRFWGALDLAVTAGIDFPWLLYKMATEGDIEPVETFRENIRSQWILGEMMHIINRGRRGQIRDAFRSLSSLLTRKAESYDDFRRSDPLPLLIEFLYYGWRFLKTRSTNPVVRGMIH